jgi:hypothetical protein
MPLDGDVTKFEADVFSVEGLRDWLRTMPPEGKYNWWNCKGQCLYGIYYAAQGLPWYDGGRQAYETRRGDIAEQAAIALPTPWTFGAALARCEAYLAGK